MHQSQLWDSIGLTSPCETWSGSRSVLIRHLTKLLTKKRLDLENQRRLSAPISASHGTLRLSGTVDTGDHHGNDHSGIGWFHEECSILGVVFHLLFKRIYAIDCRSHVYNGSIGQAHEVQKQVEDKEEMADWSTVLHRANLDSVFPTSLRLASALTRTIDPFNISHGSARALHGTIAVHTALQPELLYQTVALQQKQRAASSWKHLT